MKRFWIVTTCVLVGIGAVAFFACTQAENAAQTPTPAVATPATTTAGVCRVPIVVQLLEGKIVTKPDPAWVFWGRGVEILFNTEAGEVVEVSFEKDPFVKGHPAGRYVARDGKIYTAASVRPEQLGARDKTVAEKVKLAMEFKYSVKWSGGRAGKGVGLDPSIIIIDDDD